MSIRQKLFLSFTLIALLVLSSSLTAWFSVESIYQSAQQLLGQQNVEVESLSRSLNETLQQAQLITVVCALLAIAACLLSAILISGAINAPMSRILKNLEQTEKGELTASIEVSGNDELARASVCINRFTRNLNNTLVQVSAAMTRLSEHAGKMADNSNRSNDKASQQQHDLETLSAATQQLSASVEEVAASAEAASRNAGSADQHAGEGNGLVSRSAQDIQNLSGEVSRSTDKIRALQNRSQSIGSVLDVIQGIAEQTNLLALNAAIEAARAGDSGRGFAVVADEVRTLAQRTQQSTEEISGVISSLQKEADEAVDIMERVQEQGSTVAGNTGEAASCLEKINHAVSDISAMNLQIASAAEEQSAVTSDLAENLQRINTLSQETVAETRCTLSSSQSVSALAMDVQQLLSQFRLVEHSQASEGRVSG